MVTATVSNPFPKANSEAKSSIFRRPKTFDNIRKVNEADLDDISSVLCVNKKYKVTFGFDSGNDIITEKSQQKIRSLELVRRDVKRAIENHLKGKSDGYDAIKGAFRPDKRDGYDKNSTCVEIKDYLLALTSSTCLLNKSCSGLIRAILAMEWIGRDEMFVKTYIRFLGSLASAQGAYVEPVLQMLVECFVGVRSSSGRMNGYPKVDRIELSHRVHAALKYILRLIPYASSVLLPTCSKSFPFPDEKRRIQVSYVQNLLKITNYAPELKLDILVLITDRLVKIDVQTQVQLDDLDDEVLDTIINSTSLLPNIEGNEENDSESEVDSMTSDDDLCSDLKRLKEVKENVEKMDLILDMLFAIYSPYFSDPNSDEAISMFETLLAQFVNIILPTYRSRHTQFLLFHFAQKSEHLVDQFAGTCVQLAFLPGKPDILRQSAAAYLASFVARGAHVQPQVVQTIFDLIGSNLDLIRAENELTCHGPDLKRYCTFYALTQALLYIFCFRWRDLITSTEILENDDNTMNSGEEVTWIPSIKEVLSRTIYSKLNPLKVCSPTIVAEYAKIAHHLKFMYVYPLLETNKRIRLGQFSQANTGFISRDTGNSGYDNSWYQLDAYFPFDPYQLPVSKRWVEADYVQWKSIPGLSKKDDESDDAEDFDVDNLSDNIDEEDELS